MQGELLALAAVRQVRPASSCLRAQISPAGVGDEAALLALDLGLDILSGAAGLHHKGEGLHEALHPTPHMERQVQGGLLLEVVVENLQLLTDYDIQKTTSWGKKWFFIFT